MTGRDQPAFDLEKLRTKDKEEWAHFIASIQMHLESILKQRTKGKANPDDIKDLLQETYQKAFIRIDEFDPTKSKSFYHWVLGIGAGIAMNWRSGQSAKKRQTQSLPPEDILPAPEDLQTPLGRILSMESRRLVQDAIARLRPIQQQVISAILWENEKSQKEIAAGLNLSEYQFRRIRDDGFQALKSLLSRKIQLELDQIQKDHSPETPEDSQSSEENQESDESQDDSDDDRTETGVA
ncbi:MAG: sigma-70 family RNA polymerase sigma factor [Planctomycetota bacterium]|nr:MAG: sigma-70 family RNA polymerase sigma factor [Planctomycetota bacterium]